MSKVIPLALLGAAVTIPIGAYAFVLRPWSQRWGVDATEGATAMPGDDLVAQATGEVTRGITIGAAPADVWPWLVQMGFGRAGWYSYDRLDMRGTGADSIHSEWQSLALGDTVPTHANGGFEVRSLEDGRSLSLYLDGAMVRRQADAAAQAATDAAEKAATEGGEPAGSEGGEPFSGTMKGTQLEGFAASWTFDLRPTPEGDTRLVERVRFASPPQGVGGRMGTEAFGFAVFLMLRKQMLGIRQRAEAIARSNLPAVLDEGTVAAPA